MTKPAELRQMTAEQLELTRREVVKNLFHLRLQSATERLETPSEIQKAKREIARILTLQREAQLLEELLPRLPQAEAERIRQLPRQQQLPAVQAALRRQQGTRRRRRK
jgi:large subunit ribosomal protein L29